MIKQAALAAVVAAALSATAQGDEVHKSSRQETIGVGSGAVIGAAAGGPFGFVLGAAVGGWLGDRFHQTAVERDELAADLSLARRQQGELHGQLTDLEIELNAAENRYRRDQQRWTQTLTETLSVSVLFRTGDSSLEQETSARLGQLAALINELDPVVIQVEGYADPRGDEEFNAQLSAQRAAVVRDALVRAGVESGRISTVAHGEALSSSAEGDLDSYALDRRVEIYLGVQDPDRLARGH